jgi:RNA polymerase sigma-70 factor (ECF subfamily)
MLKNTNAQDLAEDLCQDTFYKAYKNLHSFRDMEASFSTWLYTIARNTVLSELRKAKNSEVYLDEQVLSPKIAAEKLPEQIVLRSEREELVREAINKLPEKQRSALIMREYEQLDYKEIANQLNSTVSSVKSLLFRARMSIKDQLQSYIMEPKLDDLRRDE